MFESIAMGALIGLLTGMAAERFRASMWERQEAYKYKREIYEKVLRALADYRFANNMLLTGREELGEQLSTNRIEMERNAMDELTRLTPLARTVLSKKAVEALQEMYLVGMQASQSADWRQFRQRVADLLRKTEDLVIEAARKDLRL